MKNRIVVIGFCLFAWAAFVFVMCGAAYGG